MYFGYNYYREREIFLRTGRYISIFTDSNLDGPRCTPALRHVLIEGKMLRHFLGRKPLTVPLVLSLLHSSPIAEDNKFSPPTTTAGV